MGMNKQFTVTFDVTATLSDTQEQTFLKALKDMAKDPTRGPYFDNILVAALTGGPEAALEAVIKQGLREAIKDELGHKQSRGASDVCTLKVSPAKVEVKR